MRRMIVASVAMYCLGTTVQATEPSKPAVATTQEENSRSAAATSDFPSPAPLTPIAGSSLIQTSGRLSSFDGTALRPIDHSEPPKLPASATTMHPAIVPAPHSALDSAPAMDCGVACMAGDSYDPGRVFGSVDYILFKLRRNPTPALVQVIPANLADFQANGGDLPPGAATTIYGQEGVGGDARSGMRIHAGAYLNPAKTWGFDGSYLQVFQESDQFTVASAGVPVIGRGFIDVGVNQPAFLRYTSPDGLAAGIISVNSPVEMYTFDANLRGQGCALFGERADYLAGFRYLNLRDSVTINSAVAIRDQIGATPFVIASHESFRATNQFYGGQVGFDSIAHCGRIAFQVTGKFAMGWVDQDVRIEGFAATGGNQPPQLFPNQSILYVQPTNVGQFSRSRFAVMPELALQVGFQITPRLRAMVGYDIMTVTSVERSGAAINEAVNPARTQFIQVRQDSNAIQPVFAWGGTDFWAHGLTTGLAFSF